MNGCAVGIASTWKRTRRALRAADAGRDRGRLVGPDAHRTVEIRVGRKVLLERERAWHAESAATGEDVEATGDSELARRARGDVRQAIVVEVIQGRQAGTQPDLRGVGLLDPPELRIDEVCTVVEMDAAFVVWPPAAGSPTTRSPMPSPSTSPPPAIAAPKRAPVCVPVR